MEWTPAVSCTWQCRLSASGRPGRHPDAGGGQPNTFCLMQNDLRHCFPSLVWCSPKRSGFSCESSQSCVFMQRTQGGGVRVSFRLHFHCHRVGHQKCNFTFGWIRHKRQFPTYTYGGNYYEGNPSSDVQTCCDFGGNGWCAVLYEVISKTFVRHVERSQASITILVVCANVSV